VLTFPPLPFGLHTYGGDDVRHIIRDSIGRVIRIVHARDSASIADSVIYHYDAKSRVDMLIRNTLTELP
jgi:hypothetical protein